MASGDGDRPERAPRERAPRGDSDRGNTGPPKDVASFDAAWDEEAKKEFGDLGPAEAPSRSGGDRDRGSAGSPPAPAIALQAPRSGRRYAHQMSGAGTDSGSSGRGCLRGCGCSPSPCPSSARSRSASGSGPAAVDEPDELLGASHFLEHLLFKGTETRSASEIAHAIESVGGDMNAFTTQEYTAFYVRVPDDQLEVAADILSAVVWSPAFRPDEVDSERQVILEEIRMRDDTPDDIVHELFAEALYPKHPLGRSVLGTRDTITAADARRDRASTTASTTGRATSWSPPPATSSTSRWST